MIHCQPILVLVHCMDDAMKASVSLYLYPSVSFADGALLAEVQGLISSVLQMKLCQ